MIRSVKGGTAPSGSRSFPLNPSIDPVSSIQMCDGGWHPGPRRVGFSRGCVLMRIAIADDNPIVRRSLKSLIEAHADWQVCGEATNGEQAVDQAAELKPDVIILDLGMPEKDGLEAARDIVSGFPDVPILLYTASVFSPEAKLQVRKCGIRDVIHKGASPEQLIGAVESLLPPRTRSETDAAEAASIPAVAQPESDPQPN